MNNLIIEQGLEFLKIGIMKALVDIESGENEVVLNGPISLSLIIQCANERSWIEDPDMDWDWTNGWEVNYFYYMITPNNKKVGIYGSLLNSTRIEFSVIEDE